MSLNIIDGWLQGIQHIISPFYNERPIDKPISLLVIHNISLPPNQYGGPYVEQLFTGKLDPNAHPYFASIYQLQVSSHLFIRRDGEIIQFVPFDKRAWHAGKSIFDGQENCNDFSIGIEMEGCDTENFTDIQYQQLVAITRLLQQTYKIQDITGHSDIAPDRKTDPGPYFDWQYYLSLIAKKAYSMQIAEQLIHIKNEMKIRHFWQPTAPPADVFLSQEPFCINTMTANEWLQWVFIPRMQALIDAELDLPRGFAIYPYFEEALKDCDDDTHYLLSLLKQLDDLASSKI